MVKHPAPGSVGGRTPADALTSALNRVDEAPFRTGACLGGQLTVARPGPATRSRRHGRIHTPRVTTALVFGRVNGAGKRRCVASTHSVR